MKPAKFALACLMLGAAVCAAQNAPQQTPDQPAATSPSQQSANPPAAPQLQSGDTSQKSQDNKNQAEDQSTSKDRLFFALPNFLTLENGGKARPLTTGEKFKVVAQSSFDYVQIPWYAFLAGLSQAENSEPGYGQGWEGYGKRLGSAAADGTIENFMTGAILPSLLHQDPRYYQMGKGGFWRRAGYSGSRIVITRSDSGRGEFNFSEVLGSALSASISTYSYHPRSDRNLSNTASVWASQLGYDTITIVLKEFWPDIRRKITKKKTGN